MDGSVVVRADTEGTLREHLAILDAGLSAFLLQDVEEHAVLCLARHDDYILEVLGSGTNQGDTTDVVLLDDVGIACTACHGLLEWIQVNDDEVDGWDLIFLHLLLVALVVTACQDASKYFRVKSLHTTTQDRWICGDILNFLTFITQRLDELLSTTSAQEFHTLFVQLGEQLIQAILMED